jgi:hypothetical protein
MPIYFSVNQPNQNTILYEEVDEVDEGVWAYIKEIPTTRAFGKTRKESFVNLMNLLHGDENEVKK